MSPRAWLRTGFWTVLDQALFAGANFAVNVLLARWLAPEAFGAFTVAYALFLLVGTVHGGLLVEPVLVFGAGRFRGRTASYLGVVLGLHARFALVAGAALLVVALAVGLVGHPELAPALFALALAQAPVLAMWLLRRACYVGPGPVVAAAASAVYAAVLLGGAALSRENGHLTPAVALAWMSVASVAAGSLLAFRLGVFARGRRAASGDGAARRAARRRLASSVRQSHAAYGRWASATGALEWLHGFLPLLVLGMWGGLEGSAALRALLNFAMPALHAFGALAVLMVPTFVRARADGTLRPAVARAAGATAGLGLLYWLVLALGGREFMHALYGGKYDAWAGLLPFVGLLPLVAGLGGVAMALLRAQERPRAVFGARAAAAAAAVTVGAALVGAFGVVGALFSEALSVAVEGLAMLWALRRGRGDVGPGTRPAVAARDVEAGLATDTVGGDGEAPRRLRVLVSAFACRPDMGSEPAVGWNFAREMARHHDVWVLTYGGFRKVIEAELAARPVPGLHVAYYRLPREHPRYGEEGGFRAGLREQAHYYAWQLGAARVARRLHAHVRFDLAHHVTFAKYWAPAALASLPVPYVWGPVGGGESAPESFYAHLSEGGQHYERQRDRARALFERDPLVLRTARRAALVFATTEETRTRIRAVAGREAEVRSAIALPDAEIARLGALAESGDGPVRFLSVGRLVPFKGTQFGLMAYAEALAGALADGDPSLDGSAYWIVGDGPERAELERLATGLGLAERVRFFGNVSRAEALARMEEAHVLVHPSLHDSGGLVCLEAMAAGRPVAAFRLGGSAVHVPPAAGVLIEAVEPEAAVRALAEALRALGASPERRRQMGAAGRAHVAARWGWEARVAEMAARYPAVAGRERPALPALALSPP